MISWFPVVSGLNDHDPPSKHDHKYYGNVRDSLVLDVETVDYAPLVSNRFDTSIRLTNQESDDVNCRL